MKTFPPEISLVPVDQRSGAAFSVLRTDGGSVVTSPQPSGVPRFQPARENEADRHRVEPEGSRRSAEPPRIGRDAYFHWGINE